MTNTIGIFLCMTLLISLATTLSATQAAPAAAQVCASCHGPRGQGAGIFPRIAGQPQSYIREQLLLMRSGARVNALMQPVVKNLSDREISALAAYFNGMHPPFEPAKHAASSAEITRGRALATMGDWQKNAPACTRCHGPDLGGMPSGIPALAGQSTQYLLARLKAFRNMHNDWFPATVMGRASRGLSDADFQAVTAFIATLTPGERPEMTRPPQDKTYKFHPQSPENFTPPPAAAIPAGPDGDMVWRGLQIFDDTQQHARRYVGNALNCSNCHVDEGRQAGSAPMWAAYVDYPKYREKNNKVNTIEERIQGCFRFSMNGTPPAADSPEMKALVTYFRWLATGLPVGITPKGAGYPKLAQPPKPVDIQRGAAVYAANCSLCHGGDGNGYASGDTQVFPPLWGSRSFNWGAGMQGISTAAEFIKANMPYGAGGTLSDQQAWDVAAFVVSHPRPQDPRFTGSVQETRAKYHRQNSYYGRVVNGKLLGAPENSAHTHHR